MSDAQYDKCKNTHRHLSFLVVGGFIVFAFVQLFMMIVVPVFWPQSKFQPEFWVLLGNLVGFLAGNAAICLGYYFTASAQDYPEKEESP